MTPAEVVDTLRARIPASARDLSLNLQSTLTGEVALNEAQRWEIAYACAIATGSAPLVEAIGKAAAVALPAGAFEDAQAAAALMGMNNVLYRFRHFLGGDDYPKRPARLRMNRIASPGGPKADFELACLAVSAINGCEVCVRSHEQTVRGAGLGAEHVWDAVRIAATLQGVAAALAV